MPRIRLTYLVWAAGLIAAGAWVGSALASSPAGAGSSGLVWARIDGIVEEGMTDFGAGPPALPAAARRNPQRGLCRQPLYDGLRSAPTAAGTLGLEGGRRSPGDGVGLPAGRRAGLLRRLRSDGLAGLAG